MAAISSELSANVFLGPQAEAEILLIKGMDGKSALKILLTAAGGLRAGYGPRELPDGREVFEWQKPAGYGSASAGLGFSF
jgi:hypothetical protein